MIRHGDRDPLHRVVGKPAPIGRRLEGHVIIVARRVRLSGRDLVNYLLRIWLLLAALQVGLLPGVDNRRPIDAAWLAMRPYIPEFRIVRTRLLALRKVVHLHQYRQFRRPTEQYRQLRRQRRQFAKQPAQIIWYQTMDHFLIFVIANSVKKKGVTLRENRRRQLRRPL